jgi:glycerophosphoryl diester phosphodiesterase
MAHRDWDVVVVAHRGIVSGFPENTLAAYREAIGMGFSAIEIACGRQRTATSW